MSIDVGDAKFCEQTIWFFMAGAGVAVLILGGLLIALVQRLTRHTPTQGVTFTHPHHQTMTCPQFVHFAAVCERVKTGRSMFGRIWLVVVTFSNLASLVVYMYMTYMLKNLGKKHSDCVSLESHPVILVDIGLAAVFVIDFFIRLIASNDKVVFWFTLNTIVDFFTIIPLIIMISLDKHNIGFRFLRAVRIIRITDILVYLSILRNRSSIRLCQLVTIFLGVWMAGAGFVHLLENAGNFWMEDGHPEKKVHELTIFECLWFLMVTMSTVGYGDFYPITYMGRVFVILFIISALGMFATFVPEIVEIVTKRKLFAGHVQRKAGQRHVVVCGEITYSTGGSLIRDFNHKDRHASQQDIKLVLFSTEEPDIKLRALLKRNEISTMYLTGNIMVPADLERVRASDAEAVVILSTTHTRDTNEGDWANIMRVVAIKDYDKDIKVIVQINQYQNKIYLDNIPDWNNSMDQIICSSELKMGLIAQSCLAPGFSTLLANLLLLATNNASKYPPKSWQTYYADGAAVEMYCQPFSLAFQRMPFADAAEICFSKLNIVLIAIEVIEGTERKIMVNPHRNVDIDTVSMRGYVLADDVAQAARLKHFCWRCHTADVFSKSHFPHCKCANKRMSNSSNKYDMRENVGYENDVSCEGFVPKPEALYANHDVKPKHSKCSPEKISCQPPTHQVDSTGLFHWTEGRSLEEALVDPTMAAEFAFTNHVIVTLFSTLGSPPVGLCNFIMPLRSSSIDANEFYDVVIIGDKEVIAYEWNQVKNFPRIFIVDGSPLNRSILRALNFDRCRCCVIVSSPKCNNCGSPLCDKEAVVCTLNIKTMMAEYERENGGFVTDTIPFITDLLEDSNVSLLDQDDDPLCSNIFMSQPFATGRTFNMTLLDSLITATFFNPSALKLLETVVTAGASIETSRILSECQGLHRGTSIAHVKHAMGRVYQISLRDEPIASAIANEETLTFGTLFRRVFEAEGIIIIGLFRLLDPKSNSQRRFVYTFPDKNQAVCYNDMAFCLGPAQ